MLSVLRWLQVGQGVKNSLFSTNGYHAKAKNERFTPVGSRCRENLKNKIFGSSFARHRKKITPKSVPHGQHDIFSSFNQSNHWFVAFSLLSSFLKLPSVSQVFHPFTTESLILCSSFICTVTLGAYHSSELAGRARLPANAMDQCYRNGSCFWWNLSCSSRINNLVMRSSLSSTEQRSCIRQLADPAIRLKNGKQP